MGLLAAILVTALGSVVGIVAGYYGGATDVIIMRIVDFFYAIPFIPFVIVLSAVTKPSMWNIILAVSMLSWRTVARLVRSQVLSISKRPYIKAGRVAGASNLRLMFKYILPNVVPLILLEMAFMVNWAITAEASIAFLGLGTPMCPAGADPAHRLLHWQCPGGLVVGAGAGACHCAFAAIHLLCRQGAGRGGGPKAEEAVKRMLLEAKNISIDYQTESGVMRAVEDVSFTLAVGESLGIVGESGCGKTTLAKSIIRLLAKTAASARGRCFSKAGTWCS